MFLIYAILEKKSFQTVFNRFTNCIFALIKNSNTIIMTFLYNTNGTNLGRINFCNYWLKFLLKLKKKILTLDCRNRDEALSVKSMGTADFRSLDCNVLTSMVTFAGTFSCPCFKSLTRNWSSYLKVRWNETKILV